MSRNRDGFDALLRTSLVSFITKAFETVDGSQPYQHNWHIDWLADNLTWVYGGEITRLVINMPPRYLKSHCTSVAFVAWLLGQDPGLRIVCVSYDDGLAKKFARDCRKIMMS